MQKITQDIKLNKSVQGLENLIRLMLDQSGNDTISVTEIAVRAGGDSKEPKKWKPLIRRIKLAASSLQSSNIVTGIRKGKKVDIKTTKGVIRISKVP